MRKLVVAVLLAAAAQLSADVFPVTNTRYGPAWGRGMLKTNGRDPFLFWQSDWSFRATKLVDGVNRAGHVVLSTRYGKNFDAAWTGSEFLFVGERTPGDIAGRLLDANGQPKGAEIEIVSHAYRPRLAASKDSAMLIYLDTDQRTRARLLTLSGQKAGPAEAYALRQTQAYSAIASNGDGFAVVTGDSGRVDLFLFDERARLVAQRVVTLGSYASPEVAITSDGSRYLVVWKEQDITAALLDANGNLGAPLIIESGANPYGNAWPAAAWNGDGWSVAYRRAGEILFAHLRANADGVMMRESVLGSGPSFVLSGGTLKAAWESEEQIAVSDLPLAAHEKRYVTFGAIDQRLLAAASSADRTLIVWLEGNTVRSGVRTDNGEWSEREIFDGFDVDSAVACSDGRDFVVVARTPLELAVWMLDETGRVTRSFDLETSSYGASEAIAWSGTHYAILSGEDGWLLTPSGVLSAPVEIEMDAYGERSIASDGHGFFVTAEAVECPFYLCYSVALHGARLGPGLEKLAQEDLVISATQGTSGGGVVWNGTNYVTAWEDIGGSYITMVPPVAGATATTTRIGFDLGFKDAMALMTNGKVAILSKYGIYFVDKQGGASYGNLESDAEEIDRPSVVALPRGAAAYVASIPVDDAPFHGASHVMMSIVGADTPLPAPPHASLAASNTRLIAAWTAPAGTINGYRLEYRIDDGNWIELEKWFGPGDQGASILRPSYGNVYAVRVRAFNDGGASAYSNIATSEAKKRRSMR